jgi:iron complex outermembrane recepter protein
VAVWLMLGACAQSVPLAAQQTRTDTAQTLPGRTVTATRTATTTGGASAVEASVADLGLAPATTLDGALRRLPFVGVRTNSRGEAELTIRGSESRTPTVLFDGLPVTLGWDSRTDPSLIPLSGVSTVRVTRGLTSVLGGPNAVGGVIELDASTARLTALGATLASGTDQLGTSSVAASFATPFAAGRTDGALRIAGSWRDRPAVTRPDGVSDPGARSGRRINSDSREGDLFASVRLARESGAFVGASVATYEAERGVQPELHLATPRLWRYPEQRRTFASLVGGTGLRSTPWGSGTIDVSVGVNDGRTRIENFADRSYRTVTATEDGAEQTLMSRVVLGHSFLRGGSLRMASSVANIRYDETLDGATTTRFRQQLFSVGAETNVPLTPRLALATGAALDGADDRSTGGREPLGPRRAAAVRAGLTLDLGLTQWHASASQRSRFPSLREVYSGALGRFEPNPALRPERIATMELGATFARSAWSLQGIGFVQRTTDGIVRTTRPDRRFFRINRDEIRSHGVEGIASWTRGHASLLADLLLQRVRVHDVTAGDTERRPEHVPEFRATIGLTTPVVAGTQANVWVTHTGTQFCQHPELGEQIALATQTRADVGVDREWRVAAAIFTHLRASLAVDNIANAAVYDQCGMPQPGRTLRAGISLR